MNHTIAITFDADALSSYTDCYLATLWHVAQANAAPIEDKTAGAIAEQIGREIIRRFVAATPPELWAHQGRHHYSTALTKTSKWDGEKWVLREPASQTDATAGTPRIGEHWEAQGGIYAGIVRGESGAPDYHLLLLATEAESIPWSAAKEWAAKAGGELPTRREQALLYVNLKDEFHQAWYWSGEQYAAITDYAWMQDFGYGYQGYHHKSVEVRARAVRRLPIQ